MSFPYYNYSGAFIPGTLARAEQVGVEFVAVQTGFALLAVQGTDAGAANAYVVTTKGGQNGIYTDGMLVEFKAGAANTGASTIAVDSGPVVGLTNFSGQSLTGGAISANTWYRAVYNTTYSAWTLVAPTSLVTTSNTISASAPTHLVGLTPAGGASTACAPIDVTFALDQSIVPSWTGAHTFGAAVTFNAAVTFTGGLSLTGASSQYAATLTGFNGAGHSLGLEVNAGINTSDIALLVNNQSGGTQYLEINGVGSVTVGNPTGGAKGVGTINAQALYVQGAAVLTSSVSSANPSASVGLAAVNGGASTFMTSDSAPALSQSIAPTWTAAHTFTPSSAVTAVTVNAAINAVGLTMNGGINTSNTYLAQLLTKSASGFSSGLLVAGGTTSGDYCASFNNAGNTVNYLNVRGDGLVAVGSVTVSGYVVAPNFSVTLAGIVNLGIRNTTNSVEGLLRAETSNVIMGATTNHNLQLRSNNTTIMTLTPSAVQGLGPVAAAMVDMTPDASTFTITYKDSGANSTTATAIWSRVGNLVVLIIPAATFTSSGTNFLMSGLPASIQPAHAQTVAGVPFSAEDNSLAGTQTPVFQFAAGSGTITVGRGAVGTGWTGSGTKGISGQPSVIAYVLN